jgi:hypothetical protein
MSKKRPIPARAGKWVRQELHPMLAEGVLAGKWDYALGLAESENRLPLCMALWKRIPATERAAVLAEAITGGDLPVRVWVPLNRALLELRDAGQLVFDGEAARSAYRELPETVTVYRGTVQAEVDEYAFGVCWTLDRGRAVWFATKHGRFRNTRSPPVLLEAKVPKADVCGLLFDRNEREVLVATATIYKSKPVAHPVPPMPAESEATH